MAKKQKNEDLSPRIVNRKARHDYHILETIECGIALQGSEVKSIRRGQVSLAEGYALVDPRTMQLYLHAVDIGPYAHAHGTNGHLPKQTRKLLAHRREIERLYGQTSAKGTTLVPLSMYFVRGMVKVELGVATGKKQHDKREDLKARQADREIRRAMTRKVL